MQIRNIKFNWKIALIIGLIITLFSGCEVKAADYSSTVQLRSYSLAEISTVLSLLTDEEINLSEYSNTSEFNTWILKENCGKFIFSYRSSATSTEILPAFLFSYENNNAQWQYRNYNDIQILRPYTNYMLNKMFIVDYQNKRIINIDYPANYLDEQNIDIYSPVGYKLKLSSSGVNSEEFFSVDYQKRMFFEFINWYSGPWYGVENATSSSYRPLTSEPLNANEIQEPEIIPDTIDSTYGYLWSPSANNVEINLDYKEQNQLIHGEHFIGSSLQSTFVFYYYSGDDVISFNDYVTRNAYLRTDYGTWYDFYISPTNLEYLPNNTDFYLNIYATLNDNTVTVIKDFLAFHTVKGNSGGTGGDTESGGNLGNITNPSGETTGNINLEDIIASGDSMAGDLTLEQITEKIDFNIIDNPYQALWDDLLNLLTGAMLSYGNQTITFETRTGRHTINSDDIKSPEELKTFLSIFSNTAVLMAMFIEIQKLIIKISEGNASYVLHMGDADMYFYDDCQLF